MSRWLAGRRLPLLLAVLTAVSTAALAGSVDPTRSRWDGQWRWASLWGGDVVSVAVDPQDPDFVLAGTSSGQVFASRDGGDSWIQETGPAPFAGWVIEELLFDPNHSRRVWAALKGVWDQKGFVALSEDRGRTWAARADGLPNRQVYSLAAVPGSPGVFYAGTRVGVFVTRDHGRSWHHLTASRPEIEKVTSLLVDSRNPERLWAGTWRRAYRSDDGGGSWERLDQGMALDSEVFSLLPVPGRHGDMWASTCGWVYRGFEGGDNWTRVSRGLTERRTPSFEILPSGRLLAGTVDGVFVSENQGDSWRRAEGEPIVALSLTHHPARPERVFVGSEGLGIQRSLDGGLSFAPSNRGLAGLRLAGLARAEGEVLAAVHHAHSASGLYRSRDGGLSFTQVPAELPTILDLAAFADRVFAATEKGLFERVAGEWRRLPGLGDRRIDEVVVWDDRFFIRSGRDVYEGPGAAFKRLDLTTLHPRQLALAGNTLWLSDRRGGVFRMPASADASGEMERESLSTLLASSRDRWAGGSQASWKTADGSSARLLATDDPSWPLLLVDPGEAFTLVGSGGQGNLRLDLPLRARDLTAALVVDARLILATSGFGILVVELPRPDGRALGAASTTAR